jgi:hypothetical protein
LAASKKIDVLNHFEMYGLQVADPVLLMAGGFLDTPPVACYKPKPLSQFTTYNSQFATRKRARERARLGLPERTLA